MSIGSLLWSIKCSGTGYQPWKDLNSSWVFVAIVSVQMMEGNEEISRLASENFKCLGVDCFPGSSCFCPYLLLCFVVSGWIFACSVSHLKHKLDAIDLSRWTGRIQNVEFRACKLMLTSVWPCFDPFPHMNCHWRKCATFAAPFWWWPRTSYLLAMDFVPNPGSQNWIAPKAKRF